MIRAGTTVLWVVSALVAGAGVVSARSALGDRVPDGWPAPPGAASGAPPQTVVRTVSRTVAQAASAQRPADSAWVAAPFRASRTVPEQRYTAEVAEAIEAEEAAAAAEVAAAQAAAEQAQLLQQQRPRWTLKGVVLGTPPIAILEGTSAASAVVEVGQEIDGFTITEIHADSVIVTRDELVWTFTVTPPWS